MSNSSNGGKIMTNKSFFVICAMALAVIWIVLKAHLGIFFHFSDTAILGFILGVVVTLFVMKK